MRILIIEDQPLENKLACHVLAEAGHTVRGLMAAEEALESIITDRPEITLLDMRLPGMDGLSFVRELRSDPATRSITVVALTSFPELYSRADCLAAGCDAYLAKPISPKRLPDQMGDAAATVASQGGCA